MPALPSVQIDPFLTGISVAYMNEEFVADQVSPDLPVDRRSDKYFVYNKDTFLRSSGLDANGRARSLRRPTGMAQEVDFELSRDSYFCEEYARKTVVPDAVKREAGATPGANILDPDIDAVTSLTEILKLDRESMTAWETARGARFPTAHKATLTTGGSGTSWASYASANSKPLSNIRDGKNQIRRAILRNPNNMLLTVDVAQVLADHPDVKDLTKYTDAAGLTKSGLPLVVRGLTIIEGVAQQATSGEGATTFTSANVWLDENGKNIALIFYKSPSTGPRSIHFSRTMMAPDGTTGARGITTVRYRENARKGEAIEVSMTADVKSIAVDDAGLSVGGYLLQDVTA